MFSHCWSVGAMWFSCLCVDTTSSSPHWHAHCYWMWRVVELHRSVHMVECVCVRGEQRELQGLMVALRDCITLCFYLWTHLWASEVRSTFLMKEALECNMSLVE